MDLQAQRTPVPNLALLRGEYKRENGPVSSVFNFLRARKSKDYVDKLLGMARRPMGEQLAEGMAVIDIRSSARGPWCIMIL